ncbi:MucBP domain-containing protein [Oliverpabstia intestinalis]|uniref:MucBP domain-containing protein n=1 Tax=Oliverpabstia intestinalis TaxID=2606633 RepID=UPI003F88DA47
MKKKILCLAMAAIMAVGIHTTAFAETLQGGSDWKVEFNGSKMSSNFTSADMKKDIFQLQPGDTMELQVGLKNSSFEVTGDQEYVVAYGIKGDQVAYTINYQDANGNKLADSQTFYGNVGDKPVVAYTYIDGYTPEYRNLTKTLSANAAENVFTFNYLPYETVTVTTPGQTITNTTEQTVTVPGGTTTTTGGTTGTTGGTTGTTGGTTGTTGGTGTNANGGNAAGTTTGNGDAQQDTDATGGTGNGGPGNVTDNQGTEGTENGGTTQDAQDNEDTTTIGDEDTPKADQDLKDLDDEDVPKSDKDLDGNKKVKKSLPLVAGVGIGVAALAALAAGIVIVRKRVHR